MHALHNIHAALAPDAILVDTQPLGERPSVAAGGAELGTLDMREWLETVSAVDALFAETIAAGLYELWHEERISVTDTFDTGPDASPRRRAGAAPAFHACWRRDLLRPRYL